MRSAGCDRAVMCALIRPTKRDDAYMRSVTSRRFGRFAVASVVALSMAGLGLTGCGGSDDSTVGDGAAVSDGFGDPGNCTIVDMAISSEKVALMNQLATDFNNQKNAIDGTCIFVRPQTKASGTAAALLAGTWDTDAEGPQPVIWSPASSAWGQSPTSASPIRTSRRWHRATPRRSC